MGLRNYSKLGVEIMNIFGNLHYGSYQVRLSARLYAVTDSHEAASSRPGGTALNSRKRFRGATQLE